MISWLNDNSGAVTALSSLVLAVITFVYVAFTGRLVAEARKHRLQDLLPNYVLSGRSDADLTLRFEVSSERNLQVTLLVNGAAVEQQSLTPSVVRQVSHKLRALPDAKHKMQLLLNPVFSVNVAAIYEFDRAAIETSATSGSELLLLPKHIYSQRKIRRRLKGE